MKAAAACGAAVAMAWVAGQPAAGLGLEDLGTLQAPDFAVAAVVLAGLWIGKGRRRDA